MPSKSRSLRELQNAQASPVNPYANTGGVSAPDVSISRQSEVGKAVRSEVGGAVKHGLMSMMGVPNMPARKQGSLEQTARAAGSKIKKKLGY